MAHTSTVTRAPLAADHLLQLTRFAVSVAGEAMFTIAPSGKILDANATACERLEYTRDELLEMFVADVDPHYPAERWPKHFEELRQAGRMTFETQHRSKSGRIFYVEVSVVYFEFDGREYCCSTVRDITHRKQAEQLVRLQHDVLANVASTTGMLAETLDELCRLVQEIVPNALATIMLVDPNDGCLRFEAGPTLTDEIRAAFEPLQPGKAAGSCGSAAYHKKPIIVEDTRCSEYWTQLKDVVEKFNLLACWSLPILDERDRVLGTFAISHQRKTKPSCYHLQVLETATHLASIAIRRQRFEEQLRLAHEELAHISRLSTMGEMASSLAHELNQPLAAIVNRAYVLELKALGEPDTKAIREHVEIIREQSLRAGEIVTSVRNMAKRSTRKRRAVSLNDLVGKSLVMLEPEFRQLGVVLHRELNDEIPGVRVDEIQIQQILMNLVRNAVDAMRDVNRSDRALRITTSLGDLNHVVLRVADSGPGVTKDRAESIFEPFQTTKPNGMGMGLAICKSIAESHAGQLVVERIDSPGAVFRLTLPAESEGRS